MPRMRGTNEMNILFVLAALFMLLGRAHGYSYGEFGGCLAHAAGSKLGDAKYVEFGYGEQLNTFDWQIGVGGWADNTAKPTWDVNNAVYTQAQLGLETRREGLYVSYFLGPAYISKTDALLGSNFQISHTLGIGIVDSRGVHIGLVVKHMSNAGVVRPNWGRQWAGVRVQF